MVWDMLWTGSTQTGRYSMGNIHGLPNQTWVKIRIPRMIMIPSQKDGIAMPAIANVRTT